MFFLVVGETANSTDAFNLFSGKFGKITSKQEWIVTHQIYDYALQVFQYAIKLCIDQLVMGEELSLEELDKQLEEFYSSWFMTTNQQQQHQQLPVEKGNTKQKVYPTNMLSHILSSRESQVSVKHIFILCKTKRDNKTFEYRTRQLDWKPNQPFYIGKLNEEAVRSIWQSLSVEMLYFTSDDDERYSIQAHPLLLRNLTIHAAEPPLGYPLYSTRNLATVV